MIISDLLGPLVDGARNAGISDGTEIADGATYTLAEKIRAICGSLNHFIRKTWMTRQTDTADLTANDATVDFSDIDGFDASRVVDASVVVSADYSNADVAAGVSFIDNKEAREIRAACGTNTGTPTHIEITTTENGATTEGETIPVPKANGDLRLIWSPLLAAQTATTTVPIPDDIAVDVTRSGGVCYLQNGQLENLPITNPLYAQYLQLIADNNGRATIERSFVRRVRRVRTKRPWPEITNR